MSGGVSAGECGGLSGSVCEWGVSGSVCVSGA